ncbi:hypothetical protein Vafri_7738, partial [Volvox africanus]
TKAEGRSCGGGDSDAPAASEANGSDPASSDCPTAAANAVTAACRGDLETRVPDTQQPDMAAGSLRDPPEERHVDGGSGAAAVSSSSAVPLQPDFSPLQLSSGCHEFLAMLVRDSVRLTPRVLSSSAVAAADTSTTPPHQLAPPPSPPQASGVSVGDPTDAVKASDRGSREDLPRPAPLQPPPQAKTQAQQQEMRVLPIGTHSGPLPGPMPGGFSAAPSTAGSHHPPGPAGTRQFRPSPDPRTAGQQPAAQPAAQGSHGVPLAQARFAVSHNSPGSAMGSGNPNPNPEPHRSQGGSGAACGLLAPGALAMQQSTAPAAAPRQLSLPPPQQLPPPLQQHQQQTQQQEGSRRPLRLK